MVPTGTEARRVIIAEGNTTVERDIDAHALVGGRVTVAGIALRLGGCRL